MQAENVFIGNIIQIEARRTGRLQPLWRRITAKTKNEYEGKCYSLLLDHLCKIKSGKQPRVTFFFNLAKGK